MKRLVLCFCLMYGCALLAQRNIAYRSNFQYSGTLANLWGYYDSINQKEYALVGVEFGLSIVDVTNPNAPKQLFFIDGDSSLWQEPKTWKQYAYMTNEKGTKGIMIVDMSNLPSSVNVVFWKGSPSYSYEGRSHSCFIDENGILYLTGSQLHSGVLMFDLKPNPLSPAYLGMYSDFYVHDCFARGDTLWAAEIMNGNISVVDVRDKANPVLLARFQTPYTFSHNCWLSENGKYLYTTDERGYATVASYDVSDLNNITLLDEYRHSDYDSLIPHNTYIKADGYLYTSYYRAGLTIVDAHKPDNLVEVGDYDTSPFGNANGFEGCWGVYPFLPSGNLIASDRQEGLFVLTPELKRACYLEGKITDANGETLPNIDVSFVGGRTVKRSNFIGNYKTGIGNAGKYDVRIYDRNNRCASKIITDVEMKAGQTNILDVQLNCVVSDIENVSAVDAFVSPTLFNSSTTLFTRNFNHAALVVVSDVSGKTIQTFNVENNPVNFGEQLSSGMYLVRVIAADSEKIIKILKAKN